MEHKIKTVVPINNDDYNGFKLTLIDHRGFPMLNSNLITKDTSKEEADKLRDRGHYTVNVSSKEVLNWLDKQGIDTDNVDDFCVIKFLETGTFNAAVVAKRAGDKFVADEVNTIFDPKTKQYRKPTKDEVGREFAVTDTGYRIDYTQPVELTVNLDVYLKLMPIINSIAQRRAMAVTE